MPALVLANISLYTKFELPTAYAVPKSEDIIMPQIQKDGHATLTTPIWR